MGLLNIIHRVVFLPLIFIQGTGATCNFPSNFYPYTWYSSNGGTLNITQSKISGFKVDKFGPLEFTCLLNTGSQYVSKSEVFFSYKLPFEAFLCIDITEQSANKYTYYQPTTELTEEAGNIRMKIYLEGKAIDDISVVCDVSDFSTLTNHLMIRENTINTEKITCPTALQGNFSYEFNSGNGNLCIEDSELDGCTDTSKLTYNYTKCSAIQAYSTGGELNCVFSTTNGSFTFLHVYNLDATTDESTTYRFTCYSISTSGTTVYATQSPQDCYYGQNSTYFNDTGAALVFTLSSECPSDSSAESPTTTTVVASGSFGYIIGIVIALLAILIAVLFTCWFCWKKKRDEKRRMEEEALENGGLPDESMYDVDRLMYTPDQLVTPSHVHAKITGKILDKSFEGYVEDEYMDEFGWQDMVDATDYMGMQKVDATDYMGMRKRHVEQDEYEVGEAKNVSLQKRVKNIMKSKKKTKKKGKKKKKKSKNVKKREDDYETESEHEVADHEDLRETQKRELSIILNGGIPGDDIDGDKVSRRSRFTDDDKVVMKRKLKKDLEDIESVSGIIDEDLMAGDLDTVRSLEEFPNRQPRLILPNLRETNPELNSSMKQKKKRRRTGSKAGQKPMTLKSFRRRKVDAWLDNSPDPVPLFVEDPKLKGLPTLQRVHRKKKPTLWSDILNKVGHDFPEMDLKSKRRNMSENRWRKLLEELYTDKKYFDYVNKSTRGKDVDEDLKKQAGASLDYLHDRATFWEEQKPIPPRPVSFIPPPKPKKKKPLIQKPSTPLTQIQLDSMHASMMSLQRPRKESNM